GFVASPTHSRANGRLQYLLLNGRAIRDRSLQHALAEAYRGLLLTGRYPICFLHLDMPPDIVDVNVHPTKAEVRFQDSGRLYRHLLGTLRTKFLTSDLTARYQTAAVADEERSAKPSEGPRATGSRSGTPSQLETWARRELSAPGLHLEAPTPHVQSHISWQQGQPTEAVAQETPRSSPLTQVDSVTNDRREPVGRGTSPETPAPWETDDAAAKGQSSIRALQVHNRYLVAETDNGIVVIDQHALHERILYEQLREKVTEGTIESQALLVPEPVDLSASEAAAILEHRELLGKLGVEVEPFGGETILVSAYPAMLANLQPAEVIRNVADQILGSGKPPDARDLLDDLLQMISCKAAIKAGDRLTPEEVATLVQQRHLARDSHHCPHGRPTALELTRADLDRQFKRT
ncbi:MAG: DNA mismatch repair endonuclease MutL, partial [Pirellulales bacterium]